MDILMYLCCHFLFRFDADTPVFAVFDYKQALLENWEFGKQQQW